MRVHYILPILQILNFDYRYNGADWPASDNDCGKNGQSPIDLSSNAEVDNGNYEFKANYDDVRYTQNTWEKDTNTYPTVPNTDLPGITSGSHFYSTYAQEKGWGYRFNAQQFHWHAGSEHTIDGLRYDLEVHTVHYPDGPAENDFIAAALGIIFDRQRYFKGVTDAQVMAIDNFMDDLQLDKTNDPAIAKIRYGQLIRSLDTSKRWVYRGSVTTPPCARRVYWNVLRTVYPIKQHHYDNFMIQLNRDGSDAAATYDLRISGNWRLIQPYNNQDLKIIGGPLVLDNASIHPAYLATFGLMTFCTLSILLFLFVLFFCTDINKYLVKKRSLREEQITV